MQQQLRQKKGMIKTVSKLIALLAVGAIRKNLLILPSV